MTYQDTLDRNGLLVERGTRDCGTRWAAIEDALGDARGPRCLDLGAYAGYFSIRLARQFDADVVAIDNWRGLRTVDHPNIEIINRRVTPDEVRALGPFDVTLALSVLHHIPEWADMIDALRSVTTGTLFVETADPTETLPKAVAHCPELYDTVVALDGEPIAHTNGHRSEIKRTLWKV